MRQLFNRKGESMKSQRNISSIQLALTCLVLGIFTAWAQTSNVGSVSVAVLDPAGATVPGAQLQLRDTETNDIRKAETQGNGTYSFPNLSFGVYQLTVTKPGFDTEVFQSVQVQTARVTTVNVILKVGGTTQTVTVTDAASPLLETDSSTLSDTLDTKQVVNLPVSGRNLHFSSSPRSFPMSWRIRSFSLRRRTPSRRFTSRRLC